MEFSSGGVDLAGRVRLRDGADVESSTRPRIDATASGVYIDWNGVRRRTGLADRFALSPALGSPRSSPQRLLPLSSRCIFTAVGNVKNRRRGTSRISAKHQITIPADALRAAGLEVGDRLIAHADGPGRVVLEREADVLGEFAGALSGVYEPRELDDLRDEWR